MRRLPPDQRSRRSVAHLREHLLDALPVGPEPELVDIPLQIGGLGVRRNGRAVRAGGIEERQHRIGLERHGPHQIAPRLVHVVRLVVGRLFVAAHPIELRAEALVVPGLRQIDEAGDEAPLRVTMGRDHVSGPPQHDAPIRGVHLPVQPLQLAAGAADEILDDAVELERQGIVQHHADDVLGDEIPDTAGVDRTLSEGHDHALPGHVAVGEEHRRRQRSQHQLIHVGRQPVVDDDVGKRTHVQLGFRHGPRHMGLDTGAIELGVEARELVLHLPVEARRGFELLGTDEQLVDLRTQPVGGVNQLIDPHDGAAPCLRIEIPCRLQQSGEHWTDSRHAMPLLTGYRALCPSNAPFCRRPRRRPIPGTSTAPG